jgi:ring-1,2-phenylacetyl-CoA epoxidase subunit PaaD
MAVTTSVADPLDVRRAVESVPDPELPSVTIGMLGMVHHVAVSPDGAVVVELLPTYSGCPATEMIERDVVAAVSTVDGVDRVTVRFRYDPAWSPDRIDAQGREQLRAFGIAPPGGPIVDAVRPDGRIPLPLAVGADATPRPCPYCGSEDTVRDSPFGPTPCRDLRACNACGEPFEAFRSS